MRHGLGKGKQPQMSWKYTNGHVSSYVRDDLIGMHEAQRVSNYSQLQSIIMELVMLSLAVSH